MKRWIPFVVVAFVACFLTGLTAGSASEVHRLAEQDMTTTFAQTTIAVVNADTGVDVNGVKTNYSAAIIDTLGEDFMLVSPSMAQNGLTTGTYGAVITFPADLSSKVLSFNAAHPQKTSIDFTINPTLSDKDYLDLYMKIVNLEMSVNTTLAGTYVNSIFSQVHAAQDHINQILRNDQSDLAALNDITLADFTASVNWDEVPEVQLNPTEADTTAFYSDVTSFADTVSTLYVDSYTAASTDYQTMRTDLYALIDGLPSQEADWLTQMTTWSDGTLDYGTAVEAYAAHVQDQQAGLDTWYAGLSSWHSGVTAYQAALATWYENIRVWFGSAQTWQTDYHSYLATARGFMSDVTAYRANIAASVAPVQTGLDTWKSELEAYAATLSGLHATLLGAHTQYTTQLGLLATYHTDLDTWKGELDGYHTDLANWKADLQSRQTELETTIGTIDGLRTGIAALPSAPNPADYILPADYVTAMTAWQTDIQAFAATIPALPAPADLPDAPAAVAGLTGTTPAPLDPIAWTDPAPPPANTAPTLPDLALTFPEPTTPLPTLADLASIEPDPSLTAPSIVDPFIPTSITEPDTPVIDAPPLPEDFWASITELRGQLDSFEVNAYLSDEVKTEVAGMLGTYQDDLTTLREDLATQFDSNVMQLLDAQSTYGTYLSTLRSQALTTEAAEQDKLQAALDAYAQAKTANSTDTQQRLGSFGSLMPETRTATGVNQTLVDFTVSPLQFTEPDQKPDTTVVPSDPNTTRYETWLWITIAILATLLIVTLASYIWTLRKHANRAAPPRRTTSRTRRTPDNT